MNYIYLGLSVVLFTVYYIYLSFQCTVQDVYENVVHPALLRTSRDVGKSGWWSISSRVRDQMEILFIFKSSQCLSVGICLVFLIYTNSICICCLSTQQGNLILDFALFWNQMIIGTEVIMHFIILKISNIRIRQQSDKLQSRTKNIEIIFSEGKANTKNNHQTENKL